ncbi:MAG: trypsin-like peptidase domain-containing protein [Pseudomonadota bacterium]
MTVFRGVLTVLLALFVSAAATAEEFNVEQAEQSLVRVFAPIDDDRMSSGTGFIVSEDGFILTNHHVIAGGRSLHVFLVSEDEIFDAELIGYSVDQDIALLKVEVEDLTPVTTSTAERIRGSDVFALGYPGAADRLGSVDVVRQPPTLSRGIFSSEKTAPWDPRRPGVTVQMLQHGAAVTEGNSGGPLYDTCGRVIGINTQRARREGVYFASAIEESGQLLTRHSVSFLETDKSCAIGGGEQSALFSSVAGLSTTPIFVVVGVAAITVLTAFLVLSRRRTAPAPIPAGAGGGAALGAGRRAQRGGAVPPSSGPKPSAGGNAQQATPVPRRRSSGPVRKMTKAVIAAGSGRVGAKLTGFDRDGNAVNLKLRIAGLQSPYGLVLGRDSDLCELLLSDPEISRRHVRIFKVDDSLFAEDLGSTNGSRAGHQSLTPFEALPIDYGDTLEVAGISLKIGRA